MSNKSPQIYAEIFSRHADGAGQGMMVGNSMRSDVVPMIEAGGFGVYVPHGLVWALEEEAAPEGNPRFAEIPDLGELPRLIKNLP